MAIFLSFVMTFSIVSLIICAVQLVRLKYLSAAVHEAIEDTYTRRMAHINAGGKDYRSISYPDIDQTYDNLKWYKPWERPSTLVVFEKESEF